MQILVTGATGFLGINVCKKLEERGHDVIRIGGPSSANINLVHLDTVKEIFDKYSPVAVIHLAAKVGGIGANQKEPGRFFHDNLVMGVNLIEESRKRGVEKFVQVGTVCSYPKFTQVPFKEESLWDGYPEETNAPYGIAKKALLVMGQAYRQQYNFNSIYLMPVNLYGPGDNFDPAYSHVIPAMILKIYKSIRDKNPNITLWGDGSATREFLYVDDCAEGICKAFETYDGPEPVNLGSGSEVSIKDLAHAICIAMGYEGAILWDRTKPNGQPRRLLNTSKAEKLFGFKAQTSFAEGLRTTVDWFNSKKEQFDDYLSCIQ